jgi:hypothetical protein
MRNCGQSLPRDAAVDYDARSNWVVLAYKVPAQPTRLRALVHRRLRSIDAVSLQRGVAAVPRSLIADKELCQLHGMTEIIGGSAYLLRCQPLGRSRSLKEFRTSYANATAPGIGAFEIGNARRVAVSAESSSSEP